MQVALPKRSQQLYDALVGQGDVQIRDLCKALGANGQITSSRHAQQWLGVYITRLNRKLAARGLKVTPGMIKGAYRLTVI